MRDETLDPYARVHHRVDEVLHYVWDPIGIAGIAAARDEYDSYVPTLVKMLFEGADSEAISQYLGRIESETIGVSSIGSAETRTRKVAGVLVENYRWITRT